jgi:hypothetical protein
MTNAQAYLKLKDSVVDLISNTEDPTLLPARQLINRIRSRKLYKRIGKIEIHCEDGKNHINIQWQRRLWDMPNMEIAQSIIKCGQLKGSDHALLCPDDIIIEKRQIHHGMKGDNPVKSMRFLRKVQLIGLREKPEKLPEASTVDEEEYWCVMPRAFLQKTGKLKLVLKTLATITLTDNGNHSFIHTQCASIVDHLVKKTLSRHVTINF